MVEDTWYWPPDPEDLKRERRKARELKQSQWWKNRRGHNHCHYCEREVPARELTMDHIVPLARGGKTTKANVVPCCKECNAQKLHRLPIEWEAYLERLRKG